MPTSNYVDKIKQDGTSYDIHDTELRNSKGQANGIASLDATGKVPSSQLPESGGGAASNITYDNTDSGLTSTNVQDAIDEVVDVIENLPSDNTWRSVQVNGTEVQDNTTSSGPLKLVNGTNTSVAFDSTNKTIQVNATDTNTTYTLSQDQSDGHKITLTPSTGTAQTVTVPDNNTTYTFAGGINGFKVTPSGASEQTINVTPSIADATESANGLMSASDKTKLNGIATGAEVNQNAFGKIKIGSTSIDADAKVDTLELTAGSNIELTPDATNDKVTIAVTGLGTAAAKNVPSSGNASTTEVVMGNDTRLTDSRNAKDVYSWAKASTKPTYTASEVGAIATTAKGAANGVAELDSAGLVPSSQLPSYVDDIIEVDDYAHLPITGESGKIYITKDTDLTYRWSGTTYVEISKSLALGETSSTAYRGDRGKTAYDHATETRLTTATASGLYKVASTAQGHIASLTAVTKADITALGIPGSDTNTTYSLTQDGTDGHKITLTPSSGSAQTITIPDNNTTYSLTQDSSDGHKITLTPSSGSAQTVTIPDNDSKVTSSANHYTPATASGQDKSASASGATAAWSIDVVKGVTLNTDGKGHVTGISVTSGKIPGNPNTDRYVNSAAFADDTTNNANNPVKMTLTRAGSDTATVTASIPKVSSSGAGVVPKGTAVSSQSQSTKFLREDGTWAAPSYTSIPSNNITGGGTSGYLAKFNGANTITNGPALGSDTTKYLRNDGSWATPTDTTYSLTQDSSDGHKITLTPSSGTAQTITIPDNNTWRPVQNNLTSDSTTDSLSAAQGKALANGSARDNTKILLNTSGGIGTVNGNGTAAYAFIAEIVTNSSYINRPIYLEVSGRGITLTQIQIMFANHEGKDPDIGLFTIFGGGDTRDKFKIFKTATYTWQLYYNIGTWNSITLHRISGQQSDLCTPKMTQTSTLPAAWDTGTSPTYGGYVAYASVANTANSATSATSATTASKLGSSTVGGTTTPIYLNAGTPTALSYTIATSVPSGAVFTDAKVTQTPVNTNANYEVLFSGTADNSTHTEGVGKYSNLLFNPSTSVLYGPNEMRARDLSVSASDGSSGGISLYATSSNMDSYGIMFRKTSSKGVHGYVQGNWATYFTMSADSDRGWIYKNKDNGNMASISNTGNAVFNGSVTVGGNAANTSGARMVYDSTSKAINFEFV